MSFKPIEVITRRCNTAQLRYCVRVDRGVARLYLALQASLADQVKATVKAWRLDIDEEGGRGRLAGLIQDDGGPATRKGTEKSGTTLMSWALADRPMARFPKLEGGFAALEGVTVTSIGIEFDLPGKAEWKEGK